LLRHRCLPRGRPGRVVLRPGDPVLRPPGTAAARCGGPAEGRIAPPPRRVFNSLHGVAARPARKADAVSRSLQRPGTAAALSSAGRTARGVRSGCRCNRPGTPATLSAERSAERAPCCERTAMTRATHLRHARHCRRTSGAGWRCQAAARRADLAPQGRVALATARLPAAHRDATRHPGAPRPARYPGRTVRLHRDVTMHLSLSAGTPRRPQPIQAASARGMSRCWRLPAACRAVSPSAVRQLSQ